MSEIRNSLEDLANILVNREMTQKFLEARKLFIWGPVTDESSEDIVKKLLFLQEASDEKEITLYVNSPGGVISAGLAMYDAMHNINAPVRTICTGQAASMGAVILAAGHPGLRGAWKHARVMIHQPLIHGRMYAPATDLEIQAEEMLRIRDELNQILAHHSGQSVDQIAADTDRDNFMGAAEAKAYGLIDYVVEHSEV